MRKISISADRSYEVLLDIDYLTTLESAAIGRERVAIIHSEAMTGRITHLRDTEAQVFFFPIPDGEAGKSADTLLKVWDWLGAAGFTRSDLIVGIGGGAVTDFAGFAAATWLRGLDWIAVPTTVAGMVDAAIGGKTGINSEYGKNLIGSFNSPIQVIIDLTWLSTLDDRDFAAGLAEVIKCGFIADPTILEILEGKGLQAIRASQEITLELIERSVKVKANLVSLDFKESFAREALNYGHTFGHAVELLSKYKLRHGECVSIGMAFIAYLSRALNIIDDLLLDRHLQILKELGLPITVSGHSLEEFLSVMALDKKSRGRKLRFVVLSGLGQTQRLEDPPVESLALAYERVCS